MSEEASLDEFLRSSDTDNRKKEQPTRTSSPFWGDVPEGWELVDGSDVYEVNPNPKSDDESNTYIEMDALDTELPWPRYFGKRNASEYSGKTFTAGDTLFARITPCTENGKAALVPEMETDVGIGSTEFAVLSPNRNRLLAWYLFYLVKSHPVHDYAISRMRGSTGRQRVPFSVFRRELDVALPPLEEQRKIASVLYTVDQAIQKTGEIIGQLDRTKNGLTQTFFLDGYRGYENIVEAHHRNRLPQHPASWVTKPAKDVMDVTRGAHPRPKSDTSLWGGEIPMIKIGDRDRGDSRTITSTEDTVTEKGSKNSKLVDEGTLIVSNAGTVGAARITGMNTCIHDHWLILRDYEDELDIRYLYQFINWNQDFLETLASGSTVLDLNTDDFGLFDITFPEFEEQREIADALDSLHNEKKMNLQYRNQLQRLKKGLIQDLLSGEVRTYDKNIELIDEVLQHG